NPNCREARVLQEYAPNLFRVDVEAVAGEHWPERPPETHDPAFAADQIARSEPFAGRTPGGARFVEVASEDVLPAHEEFADLPLREFLARGSTHGHLHTTQRLTQGADTVGAVDMVEEADR